MKITLEVEIHPSTGAVIVDHTRFGKTTHVGRFFTTIINQKIKDKRIAHKAIENWLNKEELIKAG